MGRHLLFAAACLLIAAPAYAQKQTVTARGTTITSWSTRAKACEYSAYQAYDKARTQAKKSGLLVLTNSRKDLRCGPCRTTRSGQYKCEAESSVVGVRVSPRAISATGRPRRSQSKQGACSRAASSAWSLARRYCRRVGKVKQKAGHSCQCLPIETSFQCVVTATVTCLAAPTTQFFPRNRYHLSNLLRDRISCLKRRQIKVEQVGGRKRRKGIYVPAYRIRLGGRTVTTSPNSGIDVDSLVQTACAKAPSPKLINIIKHKATKKFLELWREHCEKPQNRNKAHCKRGTPTGRGGTGVRM